MSGHASGVAVLLCAALLGGCTEKPQEPTPNDDRTLARLRQEVDRVNKGGAPAVAPDAPSDPNARLAGLAASREQDSVKNYPLAAPQPVQVDTLSIQPQALEAMHSLRGSGKVGLTTTDLFVRVTLKVQNTGDKPLNVTLSGARLVDAAGQSYPIARDAQTVGGTRVLDHTWAREQGEVLVLFFELPAPAVAAGLGLLIPTLSGQDARVPLL